MPRPDRLGLRTRLAAGGGQARTSAASDPRDWLAALVDGADDAIVGRTLDGTIRSWNGGATRLFGYAADEAIGRSAAILIPEDRLEEDAAILARIRRGEHLERVETRRRRKDGSLVDISLTVSVIRDAEGVVVGAAGIARDITERLRAQARQRLLLGEMRHRVKNLFALAAAIVSISATAAGGESEVIDDIRSRLSALARVHEMTMGGPPQDAGSGHCTSLLALIHGILDPYAAEDRVMVGGHDCRVEGQAVTYLSLLLHELATNAAKFGALSVGSGRLEVEVAAEGELLRLVWRETGGPARSASGPTGFGSQLEHGVMCALNARIERDWRLTGLVATVVLPRAVLGR